MTRSSLPRDRFDDLPSGSGRVGAHRAENPRLRAGMIALWAVVATLVLIAAGIFGSLVLSGRIALAPTPTPTPTPTPEVIPVVDTTYAVQVLNATSESGLASSLKDQIVAAGWVADSVTAGSSGSTDFAETTVYYSLPGDEAAARGLADVIGGAVVQQSDFYDIVDDAGTADIDESKLLTVVIGLDRTAAGATEPTPAS